MALFRLLDVAVELVLIAVVAVVAVESAAALSRPFAAVVTMLWVEAMAVEPTAASSRLLAVAGMTTVAVEPTVASSRL